MNGPVGVNVAATRRSSKVLWLLAALSLAAFVAALAVAKIAGIQPLRPDTASYLYFDPSRTIGYPAFLWVVRTLTGEAGTAVPIQMALLAGALFLLGASFHRATSRAWLSIPFQLLLLSSPEMWMAAASLISEALATALVALWCAQLLRLMRKPSLRGILLLCAAALLATTVRPSLVALFAAVILVSFTMLAGRDRWRGAAAAVIALAAAWAASPAANFLIHGSPATGSPVARGLLQHTLYCAPGTPPSDADAAFVEQHAARVRRYIESAPGGIQPVLKQLYSGELRFGLIIPVVGRRHGLDAGWQTDPILQRIAMDRIAANPQCYARSALRSYYRLATYDTSGDRDQIARIRAFLAASPPIKVAAAPLLPAEERLAVRAAREIGAGEPARPGRPLFNPPKEKPWLLMIGARLLYGGAALAGLLALLLLPLRRNTEPGTGDILAALAALGIALHGVLAVTALVELPLMRYTVPVWPVTCTALGLLAYSIVQSIAGSSRTGTQPGTVTSMA